jgi:hypothetical protein
VVCALQQGKALKLSGKSLSGSALFSALSSLEKSRRMLYWAEVCLFPAYFNGFVFLREFGPSGMPSERSRAEQNRELY